MTSAERSTGVSKSDGQLNVCTTSRCWLFHAWVQTGAGFCCRACGTVVE